MIPLGPVVARNRVGATRAAVWTFIADRGRRALWWPELELDGRVGGAVSERWSEGEGEEAVSRDAAGTIDVWVEGHALGFTWRESGDARETAVLLTLRTQGAETGITVTETGFDALPGAAERAAASQEGWSVLLRDLTTAVAEAAAAGEFSAAGIAAYEARLAAEEAPAGESAEADQDQDQDQDPAEAVAEPGEDAASEEETEDEVGTATADSDATDAEAVEPSEPVDGASTEGEPADDETADEQPAEPAEDESAEPNAGAADEAGTEESEADPEAEPGADPDAESETETEPETAAEDDDEEPRDPDFDDLIRGR